MSSNARNFALLRHRYSHVYRGRRITPTPHFHAYYQDEVGIYGIEPIERLAGSLPKRQERFVLAWAELHQEELRANWEALQRGHPPVKIEPLK